VETDIMNLSTNHYYIHATADIRKCVDEVAENIEQKLRDAYTKQLEAQTAANVKLPAITPENKPVVHGARMLCDQAVDYWDRIAQAHYWYLKHLGNSDVAYKIKDEFVAKGLNARYF